MANLVKHISTNAMHSSQELKRSREIDHRAVDAVVHDWSRFEIMPASTFDRVTTDDALRDIFKWLHDHLTPVQVMWMHAESRTETLFTAYALANILHQRRDLAASFFVSQNPTTDCASIVPTIAYQLAQTIPHAKEFIARVAQDNIIFTSANLEQVSKLIVEPLLMAGGSPSGHKLILLHGLEDCEDQDFQTSLLDNLSRALASMETTSPPPRLLVIGRYTNRLQECFSNLVSSSTLSGKVVLRPIQLHNWLGKEHAISQLMKDVELRESNLSTMLEAVIAERAAAGQGFRMAKAQQEQLRQQREAFEQKKVEQLGEELKTRLGEVEQREWKVKIDEEKLAARERKIQEKEKELKAKEEQADAHILERRQVLKEKEEQLKARELEVKKREQELNLRMVRKQLEQETMANSKVVADPANLPRREGEVNEKEPERTLPVVQSQSIDMQARYLQMEIKALEEEMIKRRAFPLSNTGSPSSSQNSHPFSQHFSGPSPPYCISGQNPSNSPLLSQVWRSQSPMFEPPSMPYRAPSPDVALVASVSSYMPTQPPSPKLSFNHLVSPPPRATTPIEAFNNNISPYQAQKLQIHESPSLGAHMYDHAGTYRRSSPDPAVVQTSPQILRSSSPQPSPSMLRSPQLHLKGIRFFVFNHWI